MEKRKARFSRGNVLIVAGLNDRHGKFLREMLEELHKQRQRGEGKEQFMLELAKVLSRS